VTELVFDCVDAVVDRYAAAPTLQFRLRIAETTGQRVHAMALRCQMRIEPARRRYSPEEVENLRDLFGPTSRYADTLNPIQFAQTSTMVPGFSGSIEVDLPVTCTYDLEVSAAKYFHGLDEGEIPLLLLFSGTVFNRGETGLSVEQVPWHKECVYRLPVAVWDALIDAYFPNSGWIRLHRDTLDALMRYKTDRGLPTWEHAFETLLKEAGEG
jgi:hypothetical protein